MTGIHLILDVCLVEQLLVSSQLCCAYQSYTDCLFCRVLKQDVTEFTSLGNPDVSVCDFTINYM